MRNWVLLSLSLVGMLACSQPPKPPALEEAIIENYADIAFAIYDDSLTQATLLGQAIDSLVATPNAETLRSARQAWIDTREPYMQSEAYRFGNPVVDAFDMRLNAWPLDESFIDYVAPSPLAALGLEEAHSVNVIANISINYGGQTLDATQIDKRFLSQTLHELGGNEAHVATGFHALEFLLWGQDLISDQMQAGARPATDFDPSQCSNPSCARRIAYLGAVIALLLEDLEAARDVWAVGGAARLSLTDIPVEQALGRMFHSLGSLAYGELAGERMKLGLMLQDPEEEHDCFSDNTHNAHYYNALGLKNVWTGLYTRIDGAVVSGPSLRDLLAAKDLAHAQDVSGKLDTAMAAFSDLRARGETIEHYDQMITGQSADGKQTIETAIAALIELANGFERSAVKLELAGLAFQGSDSLDAPANIVQ